MPGSRIPSFRPIQGKCKHYTLLWPVESIPMVLHWSWSRTESKGGIKERWHDWETKRIIAAEWCKRQWEDGGVRWSKWCHQNFGGIARHFDSHFPFASAALVLELIPRALRFIITHAVWPPGWKDTNPWQGHTWQFPVTSVAVRNVVIEASEQGFCFYHFRSLLTN